MKAVKSVVVYPVGSYARISYQAEALFAKTIYPGCHFSCRLVKSTARILYPFISSPNISRTCQEIRIPYAPYFDGFFENKSYIRRAHRAAEDTWACHCSNRQPL